MSVVAFSALAGMAFVAIAVSTYAALLAVPADAVQGNVQRIFYFHVPLAWVSFLAFIGGTVSGVLYLITRNLAHDVRAVAFVKTGWAFTSTVLVTGPLWARPVWGVFWNWGDERLLSFVMWLLYSAYLLLRATIADRQKAARIGAVLSILALANAVLVVAAIYIWKTVSHPGPVLFRAEGTGLANPAMRLAFWSMFCSFMLLFIVIFLAQLTLEEVEVKDHA